MKKILLPLLLLLLCFGPTMAQQNKTLKRSKTVFYFPDFKDAKILQPFGRFVKAKANISLKNGALCYLDGNEIMIAYTQNIIGVEFDSTTFVKIDETTMGRIVATKGYNHLLCLTRLDAKKYDSGTEGDQEIRDIGAFYEMARDNQKRESDNGIPLEDIYYFSIHGTIVRANETKMKKHIRPEMKMAFKNLMGDKWWSWEDEESLKQLLIYLPE